MAQIEDVEAGLRAELDAGQTDPSRLRALAALMDAIRGDIYAAEARAAVPPDASLGDLARDNAELKAAIAANDVGRLRALADSIDGRVPLAMREEAVAGVAARDEAARHVASQPAPVASQPAPVASQPAPDSDDAARDAAHAARVSALDAPATDAAHAGFERDAAARRDMNQPAHVAETEAARVARVEAERVAAAPRDAHGREVVRDEAAHDEAAHAAAPRSATTVAPRPGQRRP